MLADISNPCNGLPFYNQLVLEEDALFLYLCWYHKVSFYAVTHIVILAVFIIIHALVSNLGIPKPKLLFI